MKIVLTDYRDYIPQDQIDFNGVLHRQPTLLEFKIVDNSAANYANLDQIVPCKYSVTIEADQNLFSLFFKLRNRLDPQSSLDYADYICRITDDNYFVQYEGVIDRQSLSFISFEHFGGKISFNFYDFSVLLQMVGDCQIANSELTGKTATEIIAYIGDIASNTYFEGRIKLHWNCQLIDNTYTKIYRDIITIKSNNSIFIKAGYTFIPLVQGVMGDVDHYLFTAYYQYNGYYYEYSAKYGLNSLTIYNYDYKLYLENIPDLPNKEIVIDNKKLFFKINATEIQLFKREYKTILPAFKEDKNKISDILSTIFKMYRLTVASDRWTTYFSHFDYITRPELKTISFDSLLNLSATFIIYKGEGEEELSIFSENTGSWDASTIGRAVSIYRDKCNQQYSLQITFFLESDIFTPFVTERKRTVPGLPIYEYIGYKKKINSFTISGQPETDPFAGVFRILSVEDTDCETVKKITAIGKL